MRLNVQLPVGLHHGSYHGQQVDHDLVLAIAQRVVLQEEEADGEPVLDVLDAKERIDSLVQDRREEREPGLEQAVVRRRGQPVEQRRDSALGEERELHGDGARVGEALVLRTRPGRDVEMRADAAVPGNKDLAIQRLVLRRERRPRGGALGEVAHERIALEELGLVLRQQTRERFGKPLERRVEFLGVDAGEDVGQPGQQRPEQQGELLAGQRRLEQADDELAEQAEKVRPLLGALEVRPVAKQRGLEAVHQQLGAAERVEVLV